MMYMPDLNFSTELKLKRSIKFKYVKNSKAQQDAIFEQQKQFVGRKTEEIIDEQWAEYKKNNKINDSDPEPTTTD